MKTEDIDKFNSTMLSTGNHNTQIMEWEGETVLFLGGPYVEILRVPDGVQGIHKGNVKYEYCNYSVKQISIPDSVKTIWPSCFENWKALEEVVGGNGIKMLGQKAFMECSKLKEVEFNNVIDIHAETFRRCYNLEWARFNNAVDICEQAFASCVNLIEIEADDVKVVGSEAFALCKQLKTVNFVPEQIAQQAFHRSGITNIDLSKATEIGRYAFRECNLTGEISLNNCKVEAGAFYQAGRFSIEILGTSELCYDALCFEDCSIDIVTMADNDIDFTKLGGVQDLKNIKLIRPKTIAIHRTRSGPYSYYDCSEYEVKFIGNGKVKLTLAWWGKDHNTEEAELDYTDGMSFKIGEILSLWSKAVKI